MRIAIVGAGMAGLACGRALADAGCAVALFDKGRAPGGRMSTRRVTTPLGPLGFDHGAQYMTARDPAFRAAVAAWQADGVVAPWPAAGAAAWIGVPGMSAPVTALSRGLTVRWNTRVDGLVRQEVGWRLAGDDLDAGPFDAVVTALPAEQTAALLREPVPGIAAVAEATRSEPCCTALAAFAERLATPGDIVRTDGDVAWAAREAAKPGRAGVEAWVIQASPAWSRVNLERAADAVARDLLSHFFAATGAVPVEPAYLAGHRWRYAASGAAGRELLWDATRGIGACGDWLAGPRIENAWLSGRRLGDAVAETARAGRLARP